MHCVVVAHLNLAIIYASQGRYADAEMVINISKNDKHIYCWFKETNSRKIYKITIWHNNDMWFDQFQIESVCIYYFVLIIIFYFTTDLSPLRWPGYIWP